MNRSILRTIAVAAAVLTAFSAFSQSHTVRGKVTEMTEQGPVPVIGAGVLIKGTLKGGTSTDINGNYEISVPDANTVLVFSSIGYKDEEMAVGGRTQVDVVMSQDENLLEEVVVVGYGVQRRSDVSGSVTSIKAEELAASPATNVTEMMRGRASGVQVTIGSGAPGSSSSILIRGKRSLSDGSNDPLYVVDGVVATAAEFNAIAPDDVENLEILKDAASQAIYGARAANGVIIITTKRGNKDKANITFTSSISSQHLWRNFEFYSASEYYELRKQAMANQMGFDNPAMIAQLTPEQVLADEMMYAAYQAGRSTNWEDQMFSPALIQKYDLSVRGGTEKMKVAASAGWLDHKGMVNIGSHYTRGNVRLNMDYEARKWLSLSFSTSFIKTDNLAAPSSFNSYIVMSPLGMPYDEDGNLNQYVNSEKQKNPLYDAKYYKSRTATDIARLNGTVDIHPLKGLSYKMMFGYYNRYQETSSYRKKEYTGGGSAGSITGSKLFRYSLEHVLSYQVPFKNKDFSLNLTAVHSYEHQPSSSVGFGADNVPVDKYWWDMIQDGENTSMTHTFSEYYVLSYLVRAQFSYKEKYLANIACRRDGSSRFGSESKWGNFPSISAAWRINKEPWASGIRQISNLKLRASYGLVGNMNGIGNYETLGTTGDREYEFGDVYYHGYLPQESLANPYLQWESTASANFGLDFGFFKNRLNGTIEFYNTKTNHLLFSRKINSALGYTSMTDNIAKTRTYGWDINIDGSIIRKKHLEWTAGIVFSDFNNKILRLSGTLDEKGKPVDDLANKWFIGHPINVYYDYKTEGIYQYSDFNLDIYNITGKWVLKDPIERTDVIAPGKVKVKDKNKDGKIDEKDRYIIPRDPKFVGSINTGLRFWNFDFYMDWYAVYGAMKSNAYLYDANSGGSLQGKNNGIKVKYWTPTRPTNQFPRPMYDQSVAYQSSLALQDASYLRLRTLSLGYNFGRRVLDKVKMKSAKITLSATNLLTFTKFLSYSPETSPGTYPEPRQYNATFTITF